MRSLTRARLLAAQVSILPTYRLPAALAPLLRMLLSLALFAAGVQRRFHKSRYHRSPLQTRFPLVVLLPLALLPLALLPLAVHSAPHRPHSAPHSASHSYI